MAVDDIPARNVALISNNVRYNASDGHPQCPIIVKMAGEHQLKPISDHPAFSIDRQYHGLDIDPKNLIHYHPLLLSMLPDL